MPKSKVKVTTQGNHTTISGSAEDFMDALDQAKKRLVDPEKSIEIRSATLNGDFLKYGYDINLDSNTKDSIPNRKGGRLIHEDMKNQFIKLRPHLAVICEEIDAKMIDDIDDIELYDKDLHDIGSIPHKVSLFKVDAFKIDSSGENEAVAISGWKTLSTGEPLGLDAPQKKWTSDYPFINELRAIISDLVREVELYMGGKTAPRMIQPTIPGIDDDNEETHDEE